jgi:DNA (cytosine-5)-methyltransferase 1
MLRAIREIRPRWVVGENVFGLINWNGGLVFDEVQTDLEAAGYEVWAYVLPACAINAPHRRDRVWFVAHSTYTNSGSTGASRKNRETQGNGRKNNDESKGRGTSGEQYFGCGELLQPTTDTNNTRTVNAMRDNGNGAENDKGRQGKPQPESWTACGHDSYSNGNGQHWRNGEHEIEPSQRGFDAQRDVEQVVMYTDNQGLERGKDKGKIKGEGQDGKKFIAGSICADWQNFPTQSPICGGDDGLPTQLDGITFPKWRNESIKAYGNAIVPQIAYNIFKAIIETQKNL